MHNFTQSGWLILFNSGPPFPGSRNWVSCQTQYLWLENAVQCRRPTGHSKIAAAAWTHEGTYLIYGFLAPISDQGIPDEYELDTFNTPPQEQLYVTPKIGYVNAMPLFLLSFHFWATLMETTHASPPDAQNSWWLQSSFPPMPTWLSPNYGEHNPSHIRQYTLPFSTF